MTTNDQAIIKSYSLYQRHLDVIEAVARELAAKDGRSPDIYRSRALQHIIDTYAEERVADAVLAANG